MPHWKRRSLLKIIFRFYAKHSRCTHAESANALHFYCWGHFPFDNGHGIKNYSMYFPINLPEKRRMLHTSYLLKCIATEGNNTKNKPKIQPSRPQRVGSDLERLDNTSVNLPPLYRTPNRNKGFLKGLIKRNQEALPEIGARQAGRLTSHQIWGRWAWEKKNLQPSLGGHQP